MFRKIFLIIAGLYLFLVASVSSGFFVGKYEKEAKNYFAGYLNKSVEFLTYPLENLYWFFKFNQKALKFDNKVGDGVVFYKNKDSFPDNYNLLTSYYLNKKAYVELINLKTGKLIKEWSVDMLSLTDSLYQNNPFLNFVPSNIILREFRHPLMLQDSSIIAGTSHSLVKLKSNSSIEWTLNIEAHHTQELDVDNNIIVTARKAYGKIEDSLIADNESVSKRFYDDTILKLNPISGEEIYEKSFIQILIDNNLSYLIHGNGLVEFDPIHLNDAQPALTDGDFWQKGDLLLSPRNMSAIFLYRPSTNKIIWYKQGPWINQHDPDFVGKDKISVFGNQVYREIDGTIANDTKDPNQYNSIFVYDFQLNKVWEPYKNFIEKEKIKTDVQGRSKILPNGNLFIEDTDNGKIYIADNNEKILTFSKRINDTQIVILQWSRIIIN